MKRFAVVFLLFLALIACQKSSQEKSTASGKQTVISSKDGKNQITLSDGWQEAQDLNRTAALQAADSLGESFLICISEDKKSVPNITLEQHAAATLKRMLGGFKEARVLGPAKLMINGKPAIQYEIHGVFNQTKVAYVHTTIETSSQFNQIVAWTTETKFETNRAGIQKVVGSFKEKA